VGSNLNADVHADKSDGVGGGGKVRRGIKPSMTRSLPYLRHRYSTYPHADLCCRTWLRFLFDASKPNLRLENLPCLSFLFALSSIMQPKMAMALPH
jgi:hypothetical protein